MLLKSVVSPGNKDATAVAEPLRALPEPKARRLRAGWIVRTIARAVAVPGAIALSVLGVFGENVLGMGPISAIIVALIGLIGLAHALSRCPVCKSQLDGSALPAVCWSCRTILRPSSQAALEAIARRNRPVPNVSHADVDDYRRKRGFLRAIYAVTLAAPVIAGSAKFFVGEFTAAYAIALAVGAILGHHVISFNRCPGCAHIQPIWEGPEKCKECGVSLVVPKT